MARISVLFGAAILLAPLPAMAQPVCEQLVVTGHPEYPPIGYQDGDAIAGAGAMLVEAIAADLGVPVSLAYTGTWEEAQAATRDGEADIIFGIYYNDERATYLDYVEPAFALDPVVVFVPAGSDIVFTGRDDLIGLRGTTNAGESFGNELDAFIADNLDMTRADGVGTAFQMMLDGEADYMIFGLYPGRAEAVEGGFTDEIVALEPHLLDAEMFVAFSKVSPCTGLIEDFGAAITTMEADGTIATMIEDADAAWRAMH